MRILPRHFVPLVLAAMLLALGCGSEPIVVGFMGTLEGKFSDLGVQGRNGVTLAMEEANAAGGVAGRQLVLKAVNDGGEEDTSRAAVRELAGQRVVAVIGPMTSGMAAAAQPEAKATGLVMVSPTVSSSLFSGMDDNFFRVIPTGTTWSSSLARLCLADGIRRAATVSDLANAPFTVPQSEVFIASFMAGGGEAVEDIRVDTTDKRSWGDVVARIVASRAEAVYVSLSARDLALLARELRLSGSKAPLYSAMWGYTREILQAGGRSVEGIVFTVGYDDNNPLPAFQDFKQRYQKRFGHAPSFAACYGYEAAQVLVRALRETKGTAAGLSEALKGLGPLDGVQGPLRLDEFGDVERPYFLVTIRGQEFVTLRQVQE